MYRAEALSVGCYLAEKRSGYLIAAGGRGRAEEIQSALRSAAKEAGRIDVLVNAAGFTRSVTTATLLAEAEHFWDEVVDANLKGSFLASMAAPLMARPGGRIVNVSSIAAFMRGSGPGALAYASAKAGVLGLTYALARELPRGITVNAVAPGIVAGMGFFGDRCPRST